jgi:transcriptional regulator with XRE-family HTH domain
MRLEAHMDAPDDDPRKLLGSLLRQARSDAGLTQDAVGHAIGVERSGVTRMEGGERSLTLATLGTWLDRCGVGGLAESGVRAMWRVARRHGDGDEPVKTWFVGWTDAEASAWALRFWAPLIIPGLLQTERYMYEVFRAFGQSHERATEAVAVRMARQEILNRENPPTVVAIMDELVLARQLGSREVMAEQCARLLEFSEHPSVIVQVVRGASAGLGGMLALAEGSRGSVLLSGSLLEDIVTADVQQVRAAGAIVDSVRGAAVSTLDTRVILGEAHQRWTA